MKKVLLALVTAGLLALGTVNASAQTAPKSVIHVVTVSWKEDAKPEQIKAALEGVTAMPAKFKGMTRTWVKAIKVQGTATHAIVMEFADEAALKVMKANGTAIVPTLMALEGVRARLGKGIYTPTVEVKARQAIEAAGRQVRLAKAMGVTVAFGTDAGVFEHGSNAGEFALLVKAGMTPTEALASASTVAAKTLGMENEIGRIAVGYSADLVAVSENPLTNIRTLEKADWVMVRGRVVP